MLNGVIRICKSKVRLYKKWVLPESYLISKGYVYLSSILLSCFLNVQIIHWTQKTVTRFVFYFMKIKFNFSICFHLLQLLNARKSKWENRPFHGNCSPTLSVTFVSGKIMILQKNCDVINAFNCSLTSFFLNYLLDLVLSPVIKY
jgi:hypothetical protein